MATLPFGKAICDQNGPSESEVPLRTKTHNTFASKMVSKNNGIQLHNSVPKR